MEASEVQRTVFDVENAARNHRLVHRFVEDTPLDGTHIQLDGRMMLSFASCSYLGLELDPRLKEGVHHAVERYGTQFSASRTYLSAPPYLELEVQLSRIFDGFVLPTSTTTLGHLTAIPVLCEEKDAVLVDHMVHHSVQLAVTQARAQGTTVELVRHGDAEAFERRVEELAPTHRKVWIMLDGVFSMFGDLPDVAELNQLLARYPNLWLYVDDAHGMSIAGKHGRGVHLSRMGWHPRMVVATSLNKAFASAGGCVVFQNEELRDRVRLCGGPYTFGGPVQPPMLGAALASAEVHLSPDITRLQGQLARGVRHLNHELISRKLPLLEQNEVPIFFVKCGPIKMAYALVHRLAEEGIFTTVAAYPAVPLKRAGIRVSITARHQLEDLTRLAQALEHHYPLALAEVGTSRDEVEEAFSGHSEARARAHARRLTKLFELVEVNPATPMLRAPTERPDAGPLQLESYDSIEGLDPKEWDAWFGQHGTFSHQALRSLERIFRARPEPESNWRWHYFVVRSGKAAVAATFFTDALWKDDMLMRQEVSDRIEQLRAANPYFLSSRVMSMGCLLTEGNHLFLDRRGPWQEALALILDEAMKRQHAVGATNLVLRDLPAGDAELDSFLLEQGLVKMPMLDSMSVTHLPTWSTEEEFLAVLRARAQRNRSAKRVRDEVLDVQGRFTTRLWRKGVDPDPTAADFAHFHWLYQRVKQRKRRLNTFDLPSDIVERLWASPGWEVLSLELAPEAGGRDDGQAVAMVVSYLEGERMVALIAGLDGVQREVSVYRQLLWALLRRAKEAGAKVLELGMDAEHEKARMGAEARKQVAYFQLTDHFSAELIGQLMQEVSLRDEPVAARPLSAGSAGEGPQASID